MSLVFSLCLLGTCQHVSLFMGEAVTEEQCLASAQPSIAKWVRENVESLETAEWVVRYHCEGKGV